MRILVVDDEIDHRLLLRNYFSLEGWDVVLAENGQEAVTKLEQEKIDLVVSDICMPIMDGIKLHTTVRNLPKHETTPFLFVSAYDDQNTLEAVNDPKRDGFFKKGKPVSELREWVLYLTAPEDQRPNYTPGNKPKLRLPGPHRGRPRDLRG